MAKAIAMLYQKGNLINFFSVPFSVYFLQCWQMLAFSAWLLWPNIYPALSLVDQVTVISN
jgi:hypothetical protein